MKKVLRVVAVLALTVAVIALAAFTIGRWTASTKDARGQAEAFNAANATPPAVDRTDDQPVVTVVGDDMSAVAQAVKPAKEWPLIVSRALDVRIVSLSTGGSGYTAKPQSWTYGGTFVTRAPHVDPSSKAVLFFGGGNDAGVKRSRLQDSVAVSLQEAQKAAPDAKLIVVGPVHTSTDVSPELLQVRDVLKQVAADKKVQFVDPISQKWIDGKRGIFGEDGRTPTEAGQAVIADRLEPIIEGAVQ